MRTRPRRCRCTSPARPSTRPTRRPAASAACSAAAGRSASAPSTQAEVSDPAQWGTTHARTSEEETPTMSTETEAKPGTDGQVVGDGSESLTVTDNRTGKTYEVPIEDGTV